MKILVAPDSYKGTMTAAVAARAMARGAARVFPDAEIVLLPLADGGEGTADILVDATGGERIPFKVRGPLGAPIAAFVGLLGPSGTTTAVVEMAQAAGLGLVPPEQRDPRITSTYGVGQLIRVAFDLPVSKLLIGLGGSATNDGGSGAMAALGARFLDSDGKDLPPGGAALAGLARIDLANFVLPKPSPQIIALSDVTNPLVGPNGASAIYGPQKGADSETVASLDDALAHYAAIVERDLGCDIAFRPGAGAAGGLGGALIAFLGAEMRSGANTMLDQYQFEEQARDADVVLTGEGQIDQQTLSGKAVMALAMRAQGSGVPAIGFGGRVDRYAAAKLQEIGIMDCMPLVSTDVTEEEALREPERVLEAAVAQRLARFER